MMVGINGEMQGEKLTGLQSDQISPDFADAADGEYKPIVAVTTTSGVIKYHRAVYLGLTCSLPLLQASEGQTKLLYMYSEQSCRVIMMT